MEFTESYPWDPAVITFLTPIWHPNVCPQTGKVEGKVLCPNWNFSYTALWLLKRLVNLLKSPQVMELPELSDDPRPPVNIDKIKQQFIERPHLFAKVAFRWNKNSVKSEPLQIQNGRALRSKSVLWQASEAPSFAFSEKKMISARQTRNLSFHFDGEEFTRLLTMH